MAEKKTAAKKPVDGPSALLRARNLHRRVREAIEAAGPFASAAEKKSLGGTATETRAFSVADAVLAIETWITIHAERIAVKRGSPLADPAAVEAEVEQALHPFHRALVAHFGFLEIALARSYWAHSRPGEGLRILGVAPPPSRCDLATETTRFRAAMDRMATIYASDPRQRKQILGKRERLPVLTTLEGIADPWLARSTGPVDWIVDYRIAGSYRAKHEEAHTDPALGPAFALVVKLLELEARFGWIDRAKAVCAMLNAIEPAVFDGRLCLRLPRDPSLVVRFPENAPDSVTVLRVLERGDQNPVLERRIAEAGRGAAAKVFYDSILGESAAVAAVDLRTEALTAGRLREALAAVSAVAYSPS